MAYNISNLTAMETVADLATNANAASGGIFWGLMIIALFFILIFTTKRDGIERAVAAASFACLMVSIIFLFLDLVQIGYPVFFVLSLAGSLMFKSYNEA